MEALIGIIFNIIFTNFFQPEQLQIKLEKLQIVLADDIPKSVKEGTDKFVWVNNKSEIVKENTFGATRLLYSDYRMGTMSQEHEDRALQSIFYKNLQIKNNESELDKRCTNCTF